MISGPIGNEVIKGEVGLWMYSGMKGSGAHGGNWRGWQAKDSVGIVRRFNR